jgi:UDPglucose 6-dehydrogenase
MDREKKLDSYKLGIIGTGMVGGALHRYFAEFRPNPLFSYDKFQKRGSADEVNEADIIFICVPTPFEEGKGFDLSAVNDAVGNVRGKKIIVIKSTVVPGTTEKLQEQYPDHTFLCNPEFLTHNPEKGSHHTLSRVAPLTSEQDMNYPDRQIVGYTRKPESYEVSGVIMNLLPLAPFSRIMSATEAEMVKYFGNTWFATKVAFANLIYDLCQALGIDYDTVKEAAAADKRIGPSHLEVWHRGYRGYGGTCLPKDIRAFIQFADERGVDLAIHKVVEEYNNKLRKENEGKEA